MNLCKVGNQTSSVDPQAVNSRIFVGNLNTFQVTKTDVEKVFQRYGRIAGISMHKGYAFVQFTGPFDARSACLGEDGKTICGQVIDVNMVSEPKAHQLGNKEAKKSGQKRPRESSPADDPSAKNGRLDEDGKRKSSESSTGESERKPFDLATMKQYDNPDTLICGNCKEMFHTLHEIIEHKRFYCKLRFTCKCAPKMAGSITSESDSEVALLCSSCNESFANPWDLLMHVQKTHSLKIFDENAEEAASENLENSKKSSGMIMTGPGVQAENQTTIALNNNSKQPLTQATV